MLTFKVDTIEAVTAEIRKNFEVSVEIGNTLVTVYADSNKGLTEFESRLVAAALKDDGSEDLDSYLDELVNFVDHRSYFGPVVNNDGVWKASYHDLTIED